VGIRLPQSLPPALHLRTGEFPHGVRPQRHVPATRADKITAAA
jgi:hypothetical protein